MRLCSTLAMSFLVLTVAGCSSSPVVGTWTGRGDTQDAPFTFGSVSFVDDQTFTAEARYSGKVRVQSGTWNTQGEQLSLTSGDTKREYTYTSDGKTLVVKDPQSGNTVTLDRLAK
jgi:hypothetical protein